MEVKCFLSYTRLHWHWMTYSRAELEGKRQNIMQIEWHITLWYG